MAPTTGMRHLIVEVNDDDAWAVFPTPGIVVKFRDAVFTNASSSTLVDKSSKFFVNIAHCMELPGPVEDLDEDEVSKLIATDHNDYKIPVSIGNLEVVEDKKGDDATKVDVIVNSLFFNNRIQKFEFFRQLALLVICDAIEARHGVHLDASKQVILRNKKVMGEINSHRIRKNPKTSFEQSIIDDTHDQMETDEIPIVTDTVNFASKKPRNYKVQIIDGTHADIKIRIRDEHGDLVNDGNRISLKMNDDYCAIILDKSKVVADFYLPYHLHDEQAHCDFAKETATLTIKCPIDWNMK